MISGFPTTMGSWRPKLLPRFTYQAYHYQEVTDARGRPLAPITEEFTIENASGLQPVDGDVQMTLPENLRDKEVFWFATTTPVNTVMNFTVELSDRVVVNDVTYIVIRSKNWTSKVKNHYEILVVREDT
jgi:hypothetical protein